MPIKINRHAGIRYNLLYELHNLIGCDTCFVYQDQDLY